MPKEKDKKRAEQPALGGGDSLLEGNILAWIFLGGGSRMMEYLLFKKTNRAAACLATLMNHEDLPETHGSHKHKNRDQRNTVRVSGSGLVFTD